MTKRALLPLLLVVGLLAPIAASAASPDTSPEKGATPPQLTDSDGDRLTDGLEVLLEVPTTLVLNQLGLVGRGLAIVAAAVTRGERGSSHEESRLLMEEVLSLGTAEEIDQHIRRWMHERFPDFDFGE